MKDPDDYSWNCEHCGEFECDIDHDDSDHDLICDDESIWGYDGDY